MGLSNFLVEANRLKRSEALRYMLHIIHIFILFTVHACRFIMRSCFMLLTAIELKSSSTLQKILTLDLYIATLV